MIGRIRKILMIAAMVLVSLPAAADGIRDSIVSQLKQQGYREIVISRTWLGRTRILARREGERREIIINPRTGEILRDLWHAEETDAPAILSSPDGASQGGQTGVGDDDGAEGGDDDDGPDHDSGDDSGDDSGGEDDGPGDRGHDSGRGGHGSGEGDHDSGDSDGDSGDGDGDGEGDSGDGDGESGDDGPDGDD